MIRTYSELITLESFEERYEYLRTQSCIGMDTFGHERWLNQAFYASAQWKQARNDVIVRDYGQDLAVKGLAIYGRVIIHHMNPMRVQDLTEADPSVLDPEFLITTSFITHNAIHFGTVESLPKPLVARRPGDTKLW